MDGTSLITYLELLGARNTGLVAALGRSLAFEPGAYSPAYPAIEPLVSRLSERDRRAAYLVAALWARFARRMQGPKVTLAGAMRVLARSSSSVESRFVALLDADADELPWRLRQAVALAAGQGVSLDFASLYTDLLAFGHPDRYVQQRWARQFYQAPLQESTGETQPATV